MTSLEKRQKVKEIIEDMCEEIECYECYFYNNDDETDGVCFCSIRDKANLAPFNYGWDMNTAML